jgi:hypothetical protein
MMRKISIACLAALGVVTACSGKEEARKEAQQEAAKMAEEAKAVPPAPKLRPPVPGMAKLKCEQLIDVEKFKTALGEVEPVTVREGKGEADAAASCGVIRGGKRLSEKEQAAMLKSKGRLGVMAGDELCNVSAFCWTIEDPEKFKEKCKAKKENDDDSMGTYACVQVVPTGEDDVNVYRFFDQDTKCILQVRGGPSQVDNDVIKKCAITARDTIGPDQIAVGGAAPPAAPAAPAGSGSGSGG